MHNKYYAGIAPKRSGAREKGNWRDKRLLYICPLYVSVVTLGGSHLQELCQLNFGTMHIVNRMNYLLWEVIFEKRYSFKIYNIKIYNIKIYNI